MAKKKGQGIAVAPSKSVYKHVKVIIKGDADVASYYVNFAEISQSMHDFSMYVARVPSRLSREELATVQESGELVVDPVLALTFPPTMLPGLIKALTVQKDLFEKTYGPIRDPLDTNIPVGTMLS
jgi:hypothetical protein